MKSCRGGEREREERRDVKMCVRSADEKERGFMIDGVALGKISADARSEDEKEQGFNRTTAALPLRDPSAAIAHTS